MQSESVPSKGRTWALWSLDSLWPYCGCNGAEQGLLCSAEFRGIQWERECPASPLADVLRVHDWNYIKQVQAKCSAIPDRPESIGRLDMDTAISHDSFAIALVAAGAVCRAIDAVMDKKVIEQHMPTPYTTAPGCNNIVTWERLAI